ncbi:hypothetical protein G5B30_16940 [Sphingobacterium sp. SGG-5]|uniref:hypothetical protein n=1 Tax=Sphingobacterium sp. SGG-5 TaxID=2710881 RepID=UPI0013ECFDC7|nr:hypothetical protein [Sphingobacterium sp. SGG-5]NGM63598.1 hypothetical protein [Sphingobacterium sp. SGG-5]
MSTAELKISVIHKITNLTDTRIVEQIQRLLDFELEEGIYSLSKEQIARITEAREEYAAGKVISEKQANSEIDKWLSER